VETKACFTVEQKRHKGIAVLKYEFVWCYHGNQSM
jgi:hypothetical protein